MDVFQIALGIDFLMDFGAILAPSWESKWSQNRYKMVLKNNEKMTMAWMAEKSDIGGYAPTRHLGTRAQGGGGRRAKPLLQYSKDWM